MQNLVGFFMCGLPGGIDYFMLALVKFGSMSPFTEKAWNTRLNVWLRSPGLLLTAFCLILGRFDEHSPESVHERLPSWMVVAVALLCTLNGQYYMQVGAGLARLVLCGCRRSLVGSHGTSITGLLAHAHCPRPSLTMLLLTQKYRPPLHLTLGRLQVVVGNTFVRTRTASTSQDPQDKESALVQPYNS